jgi:hypothetical protein
MDMSTIEAALSMLSLWLGGFVVGMAVMGYTLTNQRLGEDRLALSRLNNFNKEGEEDEQA